MPFRDLLNSFVQDLQGNNLGIPPQGPGRQPPFDPYAQMLQGSPPSAEEQRCPRPHPQPGFTDWFILHPNPNFPPFHVCPHCHRLQIQPTPLVRSFARATSIPPNLPIACDLARFWVLFAGVVLYLFNEDRRLDISILPRVKSMTVPDGDCPNARLTEDRSPPAPPTRRMWYTVRDAQGVPLLPGWTICMHCMGNVQTICPAIAGAFMPVASGPVMGRCAFMPGDSVLSDRNAKLMHSIGRCVVATSKAGGRIDVVELVIAVRSNSGLMPYSPCPRDIVSQTRKCHMMRDVSEFTVCEDCYSVVVGPDVEKGGDLAQRVDPTSSALPSGFTCQLYSDRMQRVWTEAAAKGDIEYLRQKVTERRVKEREKKMKIAQLKRAQDQLLMQMGMTQGAGLIQLEAEMGRVNVAFMQDQLGMYERIDDYTIRVPNTNADLSMLTRMNSQSSSIQMRNAEIESQIKFTEEEWRQYWE